MGENANGREHRRPRNRVAGDGLFFPNEVVRILKLRPIDYRQLRDLFELVRDAAGRTYDGGRWARFTFQDIAALRVAIRLAGGVAALRKGRRLQLKPVRDACDELRRRFGLTHPLTQARLYREGRQIIADIGGLQFVPISGQVVFGDVYQSTREHVREKDSPKSRVAVLADLVSQKADLRRLREAGGDRRDAHGTRARKPKVVVS